MNIKCNDKATELATIWDWTAVTQLAEQLKTHFCTIKR